MLKERLIQMISLVKVKSHHDSKCKIEILEFASFFFLKGKKKKQIPKKKKKHGGNFKRKADHNQSMIFFKHFNIKYSKVLFKWNN